MEQICPFCNGINGPEEFCPICGCQLKDGGPIQDYLDPYSPYIDDMPYQKADNLYSGACVHLLLCPICHYDKRIFISKIIL